MRVLVTGAKGMLGTDLCAVLGPEHQVIARDIDDFDIQDHDATMRAVRQVSAEVIVHLAAFTDVEACEDQRAHAFRCNALGSMHVAAAARETGAHLVFVSTDYVFDGTKREPYLEVDRPCPVNFYGLTKLYAEEYVANLTTKHLILRTSWLFGPNGRNFIDTLLAKARSGAKLSVVDDQHGCPTYTLDLAKGIKAAIERRLEGFVHMTNSGEATWFELAKYALSLAGSNVGTEPVPSGGYPAKAKRPGYSVLGSLVMPHSGIQPLPAWQDAVARHLARKGVVGP